MRFLSPEILLWLWALLPISVFFAWAWQYRKECLGRFLSLGLARQLAPIQSRKAFWGRAIVVMTVLGLGILALARPQWGQEGREIKRRGADIVVVVDVSKSMLTQDTRPNRLERTKLAIRDLVKRLQGDRIGLVAFAGDAFVLCPLTSDYSGFFLSLEDLSVNSAPRGGTNLAVGIKEAIALVESSPAKARLIVVFSDGENLEQDPLDAAAAAREKNIMISTIGVGTTEGELIRIVNERGEAYFLKDAEGHFVKSRLDEAMLQKIALTTGGVYARGSGAYMGVDVIFDQNIANLEKRDLETRTERRLIDRFQIPLSFAFLFLLIEMIWPRRRMSYEHEKIP